MGAVYHTRHLLSASTPYLRTNLCGLYRLIAASERDDICASGAREAAPAAIYASYSARLFWRIGPCKFGRRRAPEASAILISQENDMAEKETKLPVKKESRPLRMAVFWIGTPSKGCGGKSIGFSGVPLRKLCQENPGRAAR